MRKEFWPEGNVATRKGRVAQNRSGDEKAKGISQLIDSLIYESSMRSFFFVCNRRFSSTHLVRCLLDLCTSQESKGMGSIF